MQRSIRFIFNYFKTAPPCLASLNKTIRRWRIVPLLPGRALGGGDQAVDNSPLGESVYIFISPNLTQLCLTLNKRGGGGEQCMYVEVT